MQGFLNINKPSGITSASVVNQIKKQFHIQKIGHMGTLDPMASGVLPIALGKATRLFDYLLEKNKQYVAVFSFGYQTNTLDADGEIVFNGGAVPSKEQVIWASKLLTGKQSQMPPQFSAKKVNGKKAYELARQNQTVELKPKEIEITILKLLSQTNENSYEFFIECTSGTYIRSICADMANLLSTYATMTKLTRVQSGNFHLENSIPLSEILTKNSPECDIITVQQVLPLPNLMLSGDDYAKAKNGIAITVEQESGLCYVKSQTQLLGIGQVESGVLKMKTNLLEEEDAK